MGTNKRELHTNLIGRRVRVVDSRIFDTDHRVGDHGEIVAAHLNEDRSGVTVHVLFEDGEIEPYPLVKYRLVIIDKDAQLFVIYCDCCDSRFNWDSTTTEPKTCPSCGSAQRLRKIGSSRG